MNGRRAAQAHPLREPKIVDVEAVLHLHVEPHRREDVRDGVRGEKVEQEANAPASPTWTPAGGFVRRHAKEHTGTPSARGQHELPCLRT